MKIYCSHVWIPYIADPNGGKIIYNFCWRCRTTYMPGQGLICPEVEIGHTLTEEEVNNSRIIKSDFKGLNCE